MAPACRGLAVTASRGNYTPPATHEAGAGKMPVTPLAPFEAVLRIPLSASPGPMVPHTPITGIPQLHVVERMTDSMAAHGAEPPPRARSVYRHLLGPHPHEKAPDRTNAFQAEIHVPADQACVPWPNLRGAHAAERPDQSADLHYIANARVCHRSRGPGRVRTRARCVPVRPIAWIDAAEVQPFAIQMTRTLRRATGTQMSAHASASPHARDNIARETRLEWAPWMTRKALLAKPIHRWFTFPHSFTSELVHALMDEWNLSTRDLLLDPFVGAGTTVLAAKQRQIPATGYDISPLAQLASRTKIADYQPSRLRTLSTALRKALPQDNPPAPTSAGHCDFLERALPGGLLPAFIRYVTAIDAIVCDSAERDFFKLALMAIVPAFSRAQATGGWLKWAENHTGPEVLAAAFDAQIHRMLRDVDDEGRTSNPLWAVGPADARCLPDPDDTYTAVITSPPYPNRHDYTRVFGVELMIAFLTEAQTRRLRYDSLQSHPEARPYVGDAIGYRRPAALSQLLEDLKRARIDARVRRMIDGYFQDIYRCLSEARRVCRRGARLAFVVGNVQYAGNSVPVDDLTAELGALAGLRCTRMYVGRYRGNSAQQMQRHGRRPSRETIVLFEKP